MVKKHFFNLLLYDHKKLSEKGCIIHFCLKGYKKNKTENNPLTTRTDSLHPRSVNAPAFLLSDSVLFCVCGGGRTKNVGVKSVVAKHCKSGKSCNIQWTLPANDWLQAKCKTTLLICKHYLLRSDRNYESFPFKHCWFVDEWKKKRLVRMRHPHH